MDETIKKIYNTGASHFRCILNRNSDGEDIETITSVIADPKIGDVATVNGKIFSNSYTYDGNNWVKTEAVNKIAVNVVKRNGQIVPFDHEKIINAIRKANASVAENDRMSENEINNIVIQVVNECSKATENIGVEDIQDMVETGIMKVGAFAVAKHYITYRFQHSQIRQKNTTDDKILSLVGLNNKEAKSENSNKNPVINSTQRDYMAGEISRDLTRRYLLPQIVLDAWNEGAIHFHDSDYYSQHMHNCFSGGTRFITDTGIREFRSFKDGEQVYVKDYLGVTRLATVHTYGTQKFNKVTLRTPQMRRTVKVTPDHRWLLSNGMITTNLQVGDTLAPTIGDFGFTIDSIEEAKAFCIGFIIGDGTDRHHQYENCTVNSTFIRLCGDKTKYANIFTTAGYRISSVKGSQNDLYATMNYFALKQDFLNGHAWRYMNPKMKELVFKGYYAADGAVKSNRIATSDPRVCEMIEEISGIAGYYISSKQTVIHDTNFKTGATLYYYHFITYSGKNCKWVVESIEPSDTGIAYCVNEPVTHTFTLEAGIVTGNCDLINLDDMLKNGTVITGTLIEPPHSFSTACNIATQIIAQVASNQYGGQSISLTHLAPFVDISRKKIRKEVIAEHEEIGVSISDDEVNRITEMRLKKEVQRGVQTIQYQVVTLLTTNGQAPFITVFMYLNEARNEQEKKDLAMIIEETLKQRYQGVKNECGVWITPAFPKLVYVLEENNITEDSPYWYLTELAAKCTAKRMVPDYLSEKKMLELKGDVFTPMGCRSFLTPDRFSDKLGNIANAGNYEPGKHKYYGRFNQGVVTINLPYIAMLSHRDMNKFWEIFDKYLDICHTALRCRHERLLGTPSDVAPILWQYGALARLKKGETIDKLLYDGYSTLSLGYAGLYECTVYMTGKSHTDPEGEPFAIQVMQHMNDKTAEWKKAENIDYSLYGTPMESTTQTFAKALKKFETVPGVNDHGYITNSYHCCVREHMDIFKKLHFESKFQEMSPGGAISYGEVPDMKDNIDAVLKVLQYIYDTIIYAELNTKSDYCQCCGYDGEIEIVKDDKGELIWKCPNCGNTDQNKMNVARRTCGLDE